MLKFLPSINFLPCTLRTFSNYYYHYLSIAKPEPTLPIYQPDMVNKELVDTTVQYVRKYHKVPDFKLINQNGDTITQKDYEDKIYITDFFLLPVKVFARS